ncbi:ATPase, partial [Microbacterium testaceum]
ASSSSPRPEALPSPLTSLIGRGDELDAIRARLSTDRLVTVIGPGGAGKTTLAVETARSLADAIIVELAPAAAGEVWTAIAGAVGRGVRVRDTSGPPATSAERVAEAVSGREVVVVLDNCEHVSREAAEAALTLLGMSAGVRVLATSREPLGIPGEAFVDLGPLPPSDAGELFARRVRSARGSEPRADERDTAARIVQRLDGLPLAIELAAARSRTLELAEIDAGLDDRFALLSHGPRLSSERHRTLRALIDWSWDTLTDDERVALRAAAVFPDGIGATDAAAAAVAFGVDADAFDALVDRSLLTRRSTRFRMLETVREYGLDRLRADGDEARYRRSAAEMLSQLAARWERDVRGPGLRPALAWFDANDENLTAALRALARAHDRRGGARLLRSLLWPWAIRERSDDLRRAVSEVADADAALDDEPTVVVEAVALFSRTFPERGETNGLSAEAFGVRRAQLEEAARRYPSEVTALIPPLLRLAGSVLAAGEGDAARTWHVDVTEEEFAAASPWSRAILHTLGAGAAQNSGDIRTLGAESDRAVRMFTEIGDPWGLGFASQLRAEWLILEGRLEEALSVTDRSSQAIRGLTSVSDYLQQRSQAVGILLRLGRDDEARSRADEVARLAEADGSVRALAQAAMTAAHVEVAAGNGDAALAAVERTTLEPGFPDQFVAWLDAQRAQALLLLGRHDEARESLRAALTRAAQSRDFPIVATVLLTIAGWNAATGRRLHAEEALARAAAVRGAADVRDPFHVWIRKRLAALPEDSTTEDPGIRTPLTDVDAEALAALLT